MEKALYVQGSTGVYEIVVINNNPQCSCQAADFGILCKHVTALFAGSFSAVINREAIKEIKPILARHPALKEFKLLDKLLKERNIIEGVIEWKKRRIENEITPTLKQYKSLYELEDENSIMDYEIKSLKEDIFKKLYTNQQGG